MFQIVKIFFVSRKIQTKYKIYFEISKHVFILLGCGDQTKHLN